MDDVPQYMTFVVRGDGEEYGVFQCGNRIKQFLSVFPSDLFQYQMFHDTMDQAIAHLSNVWITVNEISDGLAFLAEVVKQRPHRSLYFETCGNC
jgi:hypothetical protein